MPRGWLVNDTLTCIPGTKTFWHDLLDAIPELEDQTGGYTPYNRLALEIEAKAFLQQPDYIIRNASYFRRLQTPVPTIALLQDILPDKGQQKDVCDHSVVTVVNSAYTFAQYRQTLQGEMKIIPLGVDFDFFKFMIPPPMGVLPNSVLFVGANTENPKGFPTVLSLIENTEYNFCLVMKDGFTMVHPRVRVFNKVNQEQMKQIYNSCAILICTSIVETQHLAGIEAAACGIPILATNVGCYYERIPGEWGFVIKDGDFVSGIREVFNDPTRFHPREYFLDKGYDKQTCMKSWQDLIKKVCPE